MTKLQLTAKPDLKEVEQPIFAAAAWLTERGLSRMKAHCSGSGGNYYCNDIQVFAANVGLVDEQYDDEKGLVKAAMSLATWDWGRDLGGEAELEIYDDGRYSIIGGYNTDQVLEQPPVFGSASTTPPSAESGKLPPREWVVVGRIPEEETEAHFVEGRDRAEAVEAFTKAAYANDADPAKARANVLEKHGVEVYIDAVIGGTNLELV